MSGRGTFELGSAELDTLKVLWERGPSTVRDVMIRLHARGRRVAYTTVLTFLSRLEQKGLAAADKSEHAHVYRAKVSRDKVVMARVRATVEELFDGAAAPLVVHLMQSERFTPEEVAQLQQLIERLDEGREESGE